MSTDPDRLIPALQQHPDMQLHGVMGLVEDLEREFNGGKHFELMPPGTGPVGRPLE